MTTPAQTAIAIAALVTRLGQVRRVTAHPDGEPESVTTHTVMLCLLAFTLRGAIYEDGIDPQRLLIYALVHDLAEAYAGDTDTSHGLSYDGHREKRLREAAAIERIRQDLPMLAGWIDAYNVQGTRSAELVHILDKLCPRLSHILDGGASLRRRRWTVDQLRARNAQQLAELTAQHPHQTAALALFAELSAMSEAALAPAQGAPNDQAP